MTFIGTFDELLIQTQPVRLYYAYHYYTICYCM